MFKVYFFVGFSILVIILYSIVGFGTLAHKIKTKLNSNYNAHKSQIAFVFGRHLLGFFLFGFLPFIFLANFWNINFYLWFKPPEKLWFFVVLGFFTLALIMHKQVAKKQANLMQYPYIRTTVWSKSLYTFNLLAWIVYLLGYEFMFRGWLFFPVYNEIGILWATVINTLIYSLAHIPKGKSEVIGSIPFGVLLCWVTYITNNLWTAFGLHAALAISNEVFSIYYFKEATLSKKQ